MSLISKASGGKNSLLYKLDRTNHKVQTFCDPICESLHNTQTTNIPKISVDDNAFKGMFKMMRGDK